MKEINCDKFFEVQLDIGLTEDINSNLSRPVARLQGLASGRLATSR